MQIVEHCKLNKFSSFFGKFVFPDIVVVHYATTTRRYYNFAYFQIITYQNEVAKHFEPNNDIQADSWQDTFTYAFGFYVLMRTSIQACQKLCDAIASTNIDNNNELKKYRDAHHLSIKKIVDVANEIIKHPFAEPTASQPGGLDISGTMTIYQWTPKNDSFGTLEINPFQDLKTIHAYIEGLAEILIANKVSVINQKTQ